MKLFILTAILGLGLISQAEEQVQLTDAQINSAYLTSCGSLEAIAKDNGVTMAQITPQVRDRIDETRSLVQSSVRQGGAYLKSFAGGGFVESSMMVEMACTLISVIEERIKKDGCLDLNTAEVFKDGPGFNYCRAVNEGSKTKDKN